MIRISLKEKERQLIARKAELGGISEEQIARARNQGTRRTPEKRALLEEIAAEARRQGREPPFISRF
jgi:hypothetical protein